MDNKLSTHWNNILDNVLASYIFIGPSILITSLLTTTIYSNITKIGLTEALVLFGQTVFSILATWGILKIVSKATNKQKGQSKSQKLAELCIMLGKLTQDFVDDFCKMNYSFASGAEAEQLNKGQDILEVRVDAALESFKKMANFFEQNKLLFRFRNEYEEKIKGLYLLLSKYRNYSQIWVSQKRFPQPNVDTSKGSVYDIVYGNAAQETFGHATQLLKEMQDILYPFALEYLADD
jgi:hypothetical protein